MKEGTFRRRRLEQFISEKADFFGARDIINGDKHIVDKNQARSRGLRIAEAARRYLAALQQQPDAWLLSAVSIEADKSAPSVATG
jgi:hypothetical protein